MGALMRGVLLYILTLGVLTSVTLEKEDGRPEVKTQYGKLRGKTLSVKGTERMVHAFYRIPFAKPPVGSLRFAAPERPEAWSSTREASDHGPMCLQDSKVVKKSIEVLKTNFSFSPVSEDCLYLNIFTPADRVNREKLPVMMFIHGGSLVMGGASMFEGSALAAHEDVLVVPIQYRLGILGFFSNGDDRAPGNYGFMDQVAALQWVQENIADFGGDPKSVTIFGVSAGGISVSALMASPLAKGLFHKAIAESGVATVPGFVAKSMEEVVFGKNLVANVSGCAVDTIVDCLKAKSEEEIMSITASMKFTTLPATIDGVFFPKPVEQILADKEANSVPFMTGTTNQEYGWIMLSAMNITGFQKRMERGTLQEVLRNFPLLSSFANATNLMVDEYLRNETDPAKIRDCLVDVVGDFMFVMPALRTAKYHRDSGNPTYVYEYQHRPSIFKDSKPDYVKADHGDDVFSVMGAPFLEGDMFPPDAFTKEEKKLSKNVMKYWANFARTGNPNGPGLVHWPPYDQDEGYMEIDLEQKAGKQLKAKKYEFWTKELPEKMQKANEEHTEL